MVTYVFNKLLPLLFNMNTLVSHHSLSLAYTNRFYVGILEDFIVIIQAKAALTLLRMYSCFDTTFPMSELLQQIKQNLGCFIYMKHPKFCFICCSNSLIGNVVSKQEYILRSVKAALAWIITIKSSNIPT